MRVWRAVMWIVVGMMVSGAAVAGAESAIVLPRPGQVGVSGQGQYGTLFKSGDFGNLYDLGAGLGVRVRYRMRLERAIGLMFEHQTFEARDATPDSAAAPRELSALVSGVEIFQMFGTRTRTIRYLNLGVGVAQYTIDNHRGETAFPGDGVFVSVGGGLEHFFWRSTAFDLEMKYLTLLHEGETNHQLRLSAGLMFYVAY